MHHGAPSWLSNSSFSEKLLPPPPSEHMRGRDVLEDEIEDRKDKELGSERGRVEAQRRQKEKPHRTRKEEKEKVLKRRKTAWADGKVSVAEEYYVDARGDRDNLAFCSLYRMDLARFFRQQIDGGVKEGPKRRYGAHSDLVEPEGGVQENKECRYWSGLELRRGFRHVRVWPLSPSASMIINHQNFDAFIPLESNKINKKEGEEGQEEGENENDFIIQKSREFNTLIRERPDDENTWLEFAKFQDELILVAQRNGVKQQAVEKKISVLEKALEHHANSVPLMLAYLEACSLRDTVSEMLAKWEKAVISMWGSYCFWKEFLMFLCSQFSLFSVATVRAMYIRALEALTVVRDQLKDEGGEEDAALRTAELAMVSILADRCRFELQTGHVELGLGIFQAAMEYSLFAPLVQTSEFNKRRLFEAFWSSEALKIGQEGALGWALWLEKEEEKFQRAQANDIEQEKQALGGWTGWSQQVLPKSQSNKVHSYGKNERNAASSEEGDEEEKEDEGAMRDDDEATLLSRLGCSSVDEKKELENTDPGVWLRWAAEERKRGSEQWLPIDEQTKIDEQQDEKLERTVMFEDIRDTIVSVRSEEALGRLIGSFIEFCNLPLSKWSSSNDSSSQRGIEGLDSLNDSLSRLQGIRCTGTNLIPQYYVVGNRELQQSPPGEIVLKGLVGDSEWVLNGLHRAQFVCNALLLLQSSSLTSLAGRHWDLTETLLVVQCLASNNGVKASRNLAKILLKTHDQDVALWTAYALVEGAAGHMDTARKVFDTTLASLLALPNELQEDAPLVYLACADMEMSHGSRTRALYILCHFGVGLAYAPSLSNLEDPVSPTLILKAKFGFQQRLENVRRGRPFIQDKGSFSSNPSFGQGLDERDLAIIACVGLFEELSSGWEAAAYVFEESLAFTLSGELNESKECEALMERYMSLIRRSSPFTKPGKVRRSVMTGLIKYPHNSVFLEMLVQFSSSTYNLRRYFDDSVKRNPSTLLWMFALATELGADEEGNAARIQCLFERALEAKASQHSVLLWRTYLAYEYKIHQNIESARRIYFRAIHACPWSRKLWLDGFSMLSSVLEAKQLAELQEIMREKELRVHTDIYEILLQEAENDA